MNKWRPIEEYFNENEKHDWALVQFRENNPSQFMGIPHICEYRKSGIFGYGWYAQDGEQDKSLFEYLNHMCSAIAFYEWEIYNEDIEINPDSHFKIESLITAKFKDGHIENVYIDKNGEYYILERISPFECCHKYINKEDFEQVELYWDDTGIIEYRPVNKGE